MNKYIIRNCRFLSDTITAGGKKEQNICGYEIDKKCQDCTDCVLKQIVELCNLNYTKYTNLIAKEILKRLDIQEVE